MRKLNVSFQFQNFHSNKCCMEFWLQCPVVLEIFSNFINEKMASNNDVFWHFKNVIQPFWMKFVENAFIDHLKFSVIPFSFTFNYKYVANNCPSILYISSFIIVCFFRYTEKKFPSQLSHEICYQCSRF